MLNQIKSLMKNFRDFIEQKIKNIKRIQIMNKDINKDRSSPLKFFLDELIKLEGVGLKTAKLLWEAYLRSSNNLFNALDEKHCKLKI